MRQGELRWRLEIYIERQGDEPAVRIRLLPEEALTSESGAMLRTSDNIEIAVKKPKRPDQGLLADFKRLLSGEELLLSTYRVDDDQPGTVDLVSRNPHLDRVSIDGAWLCMASHFLAATSGLELQLEGINAPCASLKPFWLMRIHGQGELLVTAATTILPITVRDKVTVHPAQLLAWEETLVLNPHGELDEPLIHFTGLGRLLIRTNSTT